MRLSANFLILLSFCTSLYAQKADAPACSIQELAIAAALGDAEAQHDLGVAFHQGEDLPQDLAKAATMWRMAADKGVIMAFNNLGHLSYYGRGIKRDHAEGVRLWRHAAEKGLAESQVHLSIAYSDGRYLPRDYVEAYAWAKTGRLSAEQIRGDDMRREVILMADRQVAASRRNITVPSQLAEAERKAARYIEKYVPK
ncbi:MAG TPA: tetratricopeptide repeat protein [Pyrinomonadaceae bacterium]|nr:tetratricopeptide repeat protein [Pyrinomonadaceae bacterium]